MNAPHSNETTPWVALYAELAAHVEALRDRGEAAAAAELNAIVDRWWSEQQQWDARAAESLTVHHEINNALVGVRGNAQLLLMGPAGQQAGVRERLEVVLRESSRIQEAAGRLRALKSSLGGEAPHSRAA
ncbi:MAG: histidine kinase dimerization/phospho-acceptor domain-containing protein [Candidatus Eisenbacteria bacterium]